jgi:predicted enzyme related to lactoylglutathione lyase
MTVKLNGVTIIFNVTDLDRTDKFYRTHLGLDFVRYEEAGSTFLMTKIGPDIDVMAFRGDPKPGNTPNVVFGLAEGGIDGFVERLAAAGVEIVTPVSEAPDGLYADFRDPDGHTVSVYQPATLPRS